MTQAEAVSFLLAIVLFFAATYVVAIVCGYLVQHHDLKANYSRKIGHFMTIGIPWSLQKAFGLDENAYAVVGIAILAPLHLALFAEPIRRRSALVRMMFRSLDRPEDRPHTLKWLWTQYIAAYAAFLTVYFVLHARGATSWVTIAIIVNVFGDGLAEPVGVAFGRHAYRCRALFSRRTFQRTLEGSACVLVSGLLAVLLLRPEFAPHQFYLALGLVPISAALAEAYSPHTWDAPFLFLVVGSELVALTYV